MKNNQKVIIRKMVWDSLVDNNLILPPKPVHGRIPNFKGSNIAAKLLKTTEEWRNSKIIFSSPDSAQKKVREYALNDKKVLIMASPKLKHGYLLINPTNTLNLEKTAATIDGAFKFGNPIENFPKVDMVIEGSVAVDLDGNRLGKGGGYGDMEISHLYHQKAISKKTSIVTTVHEMQIIDKVPTDDHDKKINMIITPKRVININQFR
jgi:5-formyltetrahydrofolate cyclo-ligase